MVSFLTKHFFASLCSNYSSFEKPIHKQRVQKLSLEGVSSKNKLRIHKLRHTRNKISKYDEIYSNLKAVEKLIHLKQKQNLISPKHAAQYLTQTSKMLKLLTQKRSKLSNN